jgi:hypothetical protein
MQQSAAFLAYSITLSARPSSVIGTVRPSALAVFWLTCLKVPPERRVLE